MPRRQRAQCNATARINKMQEYIGQHTTAEWLERLDAADVPCAPILRRGEIIHNEQVVARGLIAEFDQPTVGRVRQPKPAARFEVNEAAIGGPAPSVGEHSREVLRELGYDDSAIDKMVAERALRVACRPKFARTAADSHAFGGPALTGATGIFAAAARW